MGALPKDSNPDRGIPIAGKRPPGDGVSGAARRLRHPTGMNVKDRMTRVVVTVKPQDSVRHARELLERHRINQLPVVVDDRLAGIVTDRDLRDAFPSVFDHRRNGRRGAADPTTIPVEDVMTREVLTIAPDVPVGEGARLMRRERIGALPVVDDRRLVGILTRSDVLDAFLAMSVSPTAGVRPRPSAARR